MWRWLILAGTLALACELPIDPWAPLATCNPMLRDSVWVVIQNPAVRVGRCRYRPCQTGDTVLILKYVDCKVRLMPEGRPYR